MSKKETQIRGLGSGLSKLLGDDGLTNHSESQNQTQNAGQNAGERVTMLPIGRIYADEKQPRKDFSEAELQELADSFQKTGILQPILVVSGDSDNYRIVAGERRWRAAQKAGLHEIPVIVKVLDEEQILQVALIENIHRQDLNVVEEALSYRRLVDDFGHKQDEIADFIGKSRSYVANILRLLNLPDVVLGYLRSGQLSLGHVRGLVNHENAEALAERMVSGGLSVRQAEALVKSGKTSVKAKDSASLRELSKELEAIFGVKVEMRASGRGYVANLRFADTGGLNDFIQAWRRRG